MMIKGQQWMRKKAGQWLLEGDGKKDEHSLFIWSPKSPEKHKTRFNLGQKKGAIKGKGDWEQKCMIIQHKPKNLKSSSNWKNSSLENSFKITQPRPFTSLSLWNSRRKGRCWPWWSKWDFVIFGGTPISSQWSWTLAILYSTKRSAHPSSWKARDVHSFYQYATTNPGMLCVLSRLNFHWWGPIVRL